MRKRAYQYARNMVWRRVAQGYMASFERARSDRMRKPRVMFADGTLERHLDTLPGLKLDHLHRLTDDTGMLQHATFAVPNYAEGYTTDDNARALVLTILLEQLGATEPLETANLASRYLAFLGHALNPANVRFRNLLNYGRTWSDVQGSEDCHGRALWALGTVLGRSKDQALRGAAGRLFEIAAPAVVAFTSPRAWAFALLGIQEYLDGFPGDRSAQQMGLTLAARLVRIYGSNQSADWTWFEDVLAYSNARLPQAVLIAGRRNADPFMEDVGLGALNWLSEIQRCAEKHHFVPIGSQGFYRKGGERARFDQQPIEAGAAVSACLAAYRTTGDDRWRKEAWSAFNWFLGDNDLQIALYDASTGGCRDGLHPERVNENQGAESTLAFLMAQVEMRLAGEVDGPRSSRDLSGERRNENEVAASAV
jgi:hypothetical protein